MKRLKPILIVLLSCLAISAQAQNQLTSTATAKRPFGPFVIKAEGKIVILHMNDGGSKVTIPSSEGRIKIKATMKKDGTFVVKLAFPRKTVEIFGDYNKKDEYVETLYSTPQAREALTEMDKNLSPELIREKILAFKETESNEKEFLGAVIEQVNEKILMIVVGKKDKLLATLTIGEKPEVGLLK